MSIEQIVELSQEYGGDPEWVLAGGGNTSYKDKKHLWVKASGFALATIGPEGFAQMDRARLDECMAAHYPDNQAEREAQALRDLMDARVDGEEKRPSVETLMHHLIPSTLIVHTHPALVNGITCGNDGVDAARRVLGDDVLWIRAIEPGYILAKEIEQQIAAYTDKHGAAPQVILMQNHGLVVGGESPDEIRSLHKSIKEKVEAALVREPDLSTVAVDPAAKQAWHTRIAALFPESEIAFDSNRELLRRLDSPASFEPLSGPFSPDHIVYAGVAPLFVASNLDDDGLAAAVTEHTALYAAPPRIIAVQSLGAFAVAENQKSRDSALSLFRDEVRIAGYTESFGGARHLDPHLIEFIKGWEVERFRKKLSTGGSL